MRPVVNGLEQRYDGRVRFTTLDFYDRANQAAVRKYRVVYHPTFVVLDGAGEVIQIFRGYTGATDLDAALARAAGDGR